jgi:hypothetical protein
LNTEKKNKMKPQQFWMAQISTTAMSTTHRLVLRGVEIYARRPPPPRHPEYVYQVFTSQLHEDLQDLPCGKFVTHTNGAKDIILRCPLGPIRVIINTTDDALDRDDAADPEFKCFRLYRDNTIRYIKAVGSEKWHFVFAITTDSEARQDADTTRARTSAALLRHSDVGQRLLALAVAQRRRRPRLPNELLLMVFTEFILPDYEV